MTWGLPKSPKLKTNNKFPSSKNAFSVDLFC